MRIFNEDRGKKKPKFVIDNFVLVLIFIKRLYTAVFVLEEVTSLFVQQFPIAGQIKPFYIQIYLDVLTVELKREVTG